MLDSYNPPSILTPNINEPLDCDVNDSFDYSSINNIKKIKINDQNESESSLGVGSDFAYFIFSQVQRQEMILRAQNTYIGKFDY